jgi:hypothetical protein
MLICQYFQLQILTLLHIMSHKQKSHKTIFQGVPTTSFWPATDLTRESGNPAWSPETWAQREETFYSGETFKAFLPRESLNHKTILRNFLNYFLCVE